MVSLKKRVDPKVVASKHMIYAPYMYFRQYLDIGTASAALPFSIWLSRSRILLVCVALDAVPPRIWPGQEQALSNADVVTPICRNRYIVLVASESLKSICGL